MKISHNIKISFYRKQLFIIFVLLFCSQLQGQFAGGLGTPEDPYQIMTVDQLNFIRFHLDRHFIQIADIDLNTPPYNIGLGWQPLSHFVDPMRYFTGSYNGNGFIIDGLYINRPEELRQALFGSIQDAALRNISLTNVNISGSVGTGSLLGYSRSNSIIQNCYSSGIVVCPDMTAGGLIGVINGESTVENCYSTVSVSSTRSVGGLIGSVYSSTIRNCYAAGVVQGTYQVGGLVGSLTNSQVEDSYSRSFVTGSFSLGGLIAYANEASSSLNSYWDSEVSNINVSALGNAKTTREMIASETYQGWDFEEHWEIVNGFSYPRLRINEAGFQQHHIPSPVNLNGSESDEQIQLTWEPPPSEINPAGYNVYRNGIQINAELIEESSYIDEGLTNWLYYKYHVTAVFEGLESSASHSIEVSPVLFASGSGTIDDPFRIATANHLHGMRYALTRHYIQTADIDLGVAPWNQDEGWEPIGASGGNRSFKGFYDGNGFMITNLTIDRNEASYQGLFGYISRAVLKNITLENIDIIAGEHVGGLTAYQYNSLITECSASGTIRAGSRSGGLVGTAIGRGEENHCKINKSYSTVDLTAVSFVGGLVGFTDNIEIYESRSDGNVQGIVDVGGLAGIIYNSNCSNSFSTAVVSGVSSVGGITGCLNNSTLINCYATGRFVNQHQYQSLIGGLIGSNEGGEVINCYWDIWSSGLENSAGGQGKTSLQMVSSETFQNWDFDRIWSIVEGEFYPHLNRQGEPGINHIPNPYGLEIDKDEQNRSIELSWESIGNPVRYLIFRNDDLIASVNHPTTTRQDTDLQRYVSYEYEVAAVFLIDGDEQTTGRSVPVSSLLLYPFLNGAGSEENPYHVENAHHLNNVRYLLDQHFIQTSDIDLDVPPYNEGEGWLPIGFIPDQNLKSFTGSYDGNYFTISNLHINRGERDHQALFARTNKARIQSVLLEGVDILGRNSVGSLIGEMIDGLVNNCFSQGDIQANNGVGGLIGGACIMEEDEQWRIINCHAAVSVTGETYVGGLIGEVYEYNVEQCSSSGNVDGSVFVGGLIGYFGGLIRNCYSSATVSGDDSVGGLIGKKAWGQLINSYSYGRIRGDMIQSIGGLVGTTRLAAENSYWDTVASERPFSATGFTRNTAEMTYPYRLGRNTYVNWDFENIWRSDSNSTINNGYPVLRAQMLDRPEVNLEILTIEGIRSVRLSWQPVSEARSYKIYRTANPYSDNWGEPIAVVHSETTQFVEAINDSTLNFFFVIASKAIAE